MHDVLQTCQAGPLHLLLAESATRESNHLVLTDLLVDGDGGPQLGVGEHGGHAEGVVGVGVDAVVADLGVEGEAALLCVTLWPERDEAGYTRPYKGFLPQQHHQGAGITVRGSGWGGGGWN